ncbi:HAD family phosphatase [uncultured Tenacibaculum sp.]|uniref:HAD family hydrolase n=1 Tax=uncultured Tenacibaculum sp. TaxID=174713 RepID=UPI002615BAB4|nr:HAD family phosphatase [uncultured Tenacibaculum sp.]
MPTPKGVLFDFDGVVVDSFESHYSAWSSAFRELFNEEIAPYPKSHVGKSPRKIARYFCDQIGKGDQFEDLFFLKDKHLELYFKVPNLLPGVTEFTDYLSTNKVPYGIASNATKLFLRQSIKHLNLNFPVVFGVEDYKKPKPAPEAYITLARALGFSEEEFKNLWVFEDSLTGISAAKSAGMQPIGILSKYSAEEMKAAGSTQVFQNLKEAFDVLV